MRTSVTSPSSPGRRSGVTSPADRGVLLQERPWEAVFTVNETRDERDPEEFLLTWEDWERYAEKYARIFVSQGFEPGDRVVVCTSYGMNVGANTMTLAAVTSGWRSSRRGSAPSCRVMANYRPTAVIGSVFKLLRLARRMEAEGIRRRKPA
jgi:hypothetical protein